MCLKPLKIRNPAKSISIYGGAPLYLEVPCGNCADCKKNKRLEWNFRTYHEVSDCILHGGYVLFDTLTYAPQHVPHISDFVDISSMNGVTDFMCFNYKHVQDFLKNLRRQLQYHYRGVTIKYFLTTEYGTDDNYTHRPHIHILIFVYLNGVELSPYDMSILVSQCWEYGRTDGLPYKSRKYVAEHVYGYDLGQKNHLNFLPVCSYVSKYITKDSTFQKEINNRIELIKKYVDNDTLKILFRNISMFHRQSQGFGISYLNTLSADERKYIHDNGACRIVDSNKVVCVIALPLYYKRKLFYNLKKNEEKKYYWELTEHGKDYVCSRMLSAISTYSTRIMSLLSNSSQDDISYISHLLQGRTLEEYSIYKLFYCGRYRVATDYRSTDTECNLYDIQQNIRKSLTPHKLNDCELLSRDVENDIVHVPHNPELFSTLTRDTYNYTNFLSQHVYNENSFPEFCNFDKITAYLESIDYKNVKNKQLTFDFIEVLQKKFKVLYYE